MCWDWKVFFRNQITVKCTDQFKPKNKKERIVPMNEKPELYYSNILIVHPINLMEFINITLFIPILNDHDNFSMSDKECWFTKEKTSSIGYYSNQYKQYLNPFL